MRKIVFSTSFSLIVGTVSDAKDDKSKSLKRSIVSSKSSTSRPSKVVKKSKYLIELLIYKPLPPSTAKRLEKSRLACFVKIKTDGGDSSANGVATENSTEDAAELLSADESEKSAANAATCNNVGGEAKTKHGFDSIVCDKSVANPEDLSDLFPSNIPLKSISTDVKKLPDEMYWHVKLGHLPTTSLKVLSKFDERMKDIAFDNVAEECDVCKVAKVTDRSAKRTRDVAKKPLESIHLHVVGPIQPVSKADGRRYIAIFVDEYSRVTMANVLKSKSEIGDKFESFVKNARRELGTKAEVRYVRMYDKMDFTGDYMKTVVDREGISVQATPSDIPALAKEFVKVLQERVRSMMFDTRLPKRMWDLALAMAVYTYNRTPLDALGFDIPYQRFSPQAQHEPRSFRRFGCVAYASLSRKNQPTKATSEIPLPSDVPGDLPPGDEAPGEESKPKDEEKTDDDDCWANGSNVLRCIFVGYTNSAFLLFHPESNLFTESSKVRCNEKVVYGDIYTKSPVKDVIVESIDAEWLKSLSIDDESSSSSSSRRDDYHRSSSKRRRY